MRLWSILLILLTAPVTAYSGAWLREKGKGFSSNTVSVTQNYDISESTFLEYGVRDDLTLGAEVSFLASSYGLQSGSATLFLRRPLGRQGRPNVWSAELGIGAAWVGDVVTPNVKAGLSWGRGFTLAEKNGWITIDSSLSWDVYLQEHLAKVDSTVGINLGERFSGMLQIFHASTSTTTATSIAPSIIVRPIKSRPDIRLQIGAETLITDSSNPALKLSIWREF
ncbi:MAG: hypothetical protein KBT62_00220 [Sulfitobacter litoralis]|jgi:hypothetical protein|uniref:Outer membrane protein beta-barrel domain-containing protein n=2 Tax=root TaxID=1 RepID=A0A7V1BD47_9RHOB|nr:MULTISPECIES: hypothetical protein [Sulfitobacter]MBQ0764752.1 hypothetical protein [Sulfitobacter litoralis]MCF7727032.1 hypothetical protein [Sulfitobacter sp. M22]MCF7778409.1 hypothetical protein [Sulfitobacter sp. M220]HDZ50963.1 hypothetical protein [Sulfitobacter litoralis]|tara:strand:- start:1753 stop:2424 length:672 start_codon:yes stop_codon:yes gene_type:complete